MKLIMVIFMCFVSLNSTAFAAQNVTILVDNGHLAPLKFNNKDGSVTGIFPEIVRTAVSRMPDYTVDFKEVPWVRAKRRIKNGASFAMLPPYFHAHDWLTDTEPKRPYIWPYSLPLVAHTDAVVCDITKLTRPRENWPEDYQDLSFAMNRGDGIAGEKFQRLADKKEIQVKLFISNLHAVKQVLKGEQDCTVIPQMVLNYLISEMKISGEYATFDKEITLKSRIIGSNIGYLGYTDINAEKNFPYKKDFSIKFDIEIYKMKKQGEIKAIINKFTNYQ